MTIDKSWSNDYVIFSEEESNRQDEPIFWSNIDGWGNLDSATIFSSEETEFLRLPISGDKDDAKWMKLEEAVSLHNAQCFKRNKVN